MNRDEALSLGMWIMLFPITLPVYLGAAIVRRVWL